MIEDTAISSRAIGQFPLSIATSLAFESLFGIYPEVPPVVPAPLLKYEELWINLSTLYRNFMGALHKDAVIQVHPIDIAEALMVEVDQIRRIIEDGNRGNTKVVIYFSHYKDLDKVYKHALIRSDNTDRQKDYTITHDKTIEYMLKSHPEAFVVFDRKIITQQQKKAVILTHYAYDLFSRYQFKDLTLLESHTGRFKKKDLWYTKYHNGKDLPFIPFREDMIQIFGDSEHFRPMDIRLKRDVIALAQSHGWSAVTTTDKIRLNVSGMPSGESKETIKSLLIS